MEKDEESQSLMHDEDFDLDLDDAPVQPPSPLKAAAASKSSDEEETKRDEPPPSKKRPREFSDDSSDESEESSNDSSSIPRSAASKLLGKRRLISKKRAKKNEEALDKVMGELIGLEMKTDNLGISDDDGDEHSTQRIPTADMPNAEPLARLQNALFGSQDDADLLEDGAGAANDADVEMRDADEGTGPGNAEHGSDDDISIALTDDGIPVESRGLDIGIVRCTYAANPTVEGWVPFALEAVDNTVEGVTIDENALLTIPWGVYCLHGGMSDDAGSKFARRKRLEFIPDVVARKLSDVPWFILMAPEQVLRYMASPFFTYKVRVLRVDPVRVKFSWRPEVPIFYVVGLDEKSPLWPVDSAWQPIQLQRMFTDTLYAHLEKTVRVKGHELESAVKKVLINIAEFPLPINKPAETLLPPHDVPMNNYSLRPERIERIKEILTNRFKTAVAPVSVITPMQARCVDVTPLSQAVGSYVTSADYIFMDLEKPYHLWQQYLAEAGFPVDVISRVSYWARNKPDEVVARFAPLEAFVGRLKDFERPLSMMDHIKLCEHVAFSPDWFDDWFRHTRQGSNREERKTVYAFFSACELWRQIQHDAARYGSVSTYLFTKARRDFFFEHHFIWCSANYAHVLRLTKGRDTRTKYDALTQDETQEIMQQIIAIVDRFNRAHQPPLYRIQADDRGSITSTSAINADRYDTSDKLAKFIMLVALQWKNLRHKIEPRMLRSLSPLVVQCATIYGNKSGNSPDDFYEDIQRTMGGGLVMLIIKPYSSKNELIKFLQNERDSRKLGINPPQVIVFDRFHNWSLEIIASCLYNLKHFKLESRCTNLIFTGFAHSMGYINGGGSIIWELLDIAERLDSELYMSLRGSSSDDASAATGNKSTASRLFDKQTMRWKSAIRGLLSEQHYSMEDREEQLLANDALFVARRTSNLEQISEALVTTLNSRKCKTVAVLFARFTTSKRIQAEIRKHNPALLSITPVPIQFFGYRDIELKPAILANRDLIVLADIDYRGANRPTYLHINAAFEHARKGVLIVSDKLSTADEERPVSLIADVFHRNDEKSDRYLMSIGRCPVVKERFERLVSAPKVTAILRATISSTQNNNNNNNNSD